MPATCGLNLLKDIVHYRTYAMTLEDGRKETRSQTIERNCAMHVQSFPTHAAEIREAYAQVQAGRVVPSMRSLQFAGAAIAKSHARIYNCAYTPLEGFQDFAELFFLLMNGCGVGFSVQRRHIRHLPFVAPPTQASYMHVEDNKEGWCDSLLALLSSPGTRFDYADIRAHGAPLSTGGTASGPAPLRRAHDHVRAILLKAVGRRLRPIECHDIVCHVADAVVVGGVRRAALISLFDADDTEMLGSKSGDWWVVNPQRARANNSAVIERGTSSFDRVLGDILSQCFDNGTGEPGVSLSWDPLGYGYNPCHEIALTNRQMCNLTEVNVAACRNERDFLKAVRAATVIGTLQASYTDFQYLSRDWKTNCEREALLGVSLTGLAENWALFADPTSLRKGAELMLQENALWAARLGIARAARIGCVKPSGTTSAFLGTTSGIHAAHAPYYIRRVRISRSDPLATYLTAVFGCPDTPYEKGCFRAVEGDVTNQDNIILALPVAVGDAICRNTESSVELLNRAKHIQEHWIAPSHRSGRNHHNVSLTVSYQSHEKDEIASWMRANPHAFSGVSLLPYDGGDYPQLPFEEISEAEFQAFSSQFSRELDLRDIAVQADLDVREHEMACAGGTCEYV